MEYEKHMLDQLDRIVELLEQMCKVQGILKDPDVALKGGLCWSCRYFEQGADYNECKRLGDYCYPAHRVTECPEYEEWGEYKEWKEE